MSIVQISKIQQRRGLSENLPQLASAELGWSLDTRQLYIGNGTLAEGAPQVGNTRILTELDLVSLGNFYEQTLTNNTVLGTITNMSFGTIVPGATIDYVIVRPTGGDDAVRTGCLKISKAGSNLAWDDEFVESTPMGLTLSVQVVSGLAQVYYTTTDTSFDAEIQYKITSFIF